MLFVLKKIARPFRRLSDIINKIPFAGKFATRPISFWAYKAVTWEEKFIRISLALGFLIAFMFFHYLQLKLGWGLYTKSSLMVLQAIGMLYAIANALVIYAQSILSFRLIKVACRSSKRKSCRLSYKPYEFGYIVLCLVVTLGGQAVFLTANAFA